jgi:hypothetical protein
MSGAIVGGAIAAAGALGGAALSSHAAGKAASEQSSAANYAADLQYKASQDALAFQEKQWDTQQANLAPWLQSGKEGLSQLDYLLGVGSPNGSGSPSGKFGSLMQANPYSTFTAPTALTEKNDPGYQARLKLGTDALQRSAAARGSLLTGGTAQGLNQFAQDYASNEYGNVYNRAFNNNAFDYNSFNQNQANQYNRLASLAGVGQQTAGQLGYLGNQASQNVSNNLLSTAGMMGQDYQNAAAANASGYVGSANAWGGALNSIGGNLSQLLMLQQIMRGTGAADANTWDTYSANGWTP